MTTTHRSRSELVRYCVGIAVSIGMLWLGAPRAVAAAADDAAWELTGVSTPESDAIEKSLAKLLTQYDDMQVKIQAQKQNLRDAPLYKQSQDLLHQALALADQVADKRAHAALEQRCLAPPKQSAPATASGTSPHLCSRVLAGSKDGGNDPWAVCSCVHQYLLGAKQELDEIHSRAKGFVGKNYIAGGISDDLLKGWGGDEFVISDDVINRNFQDATNSNLQPDQVIDTEAVLREFRVVESIQRQIAEWRVTNHDPNLRRATSLLGIEQSALLYPQLRNAYSLLQGAIRHLWIAHQMEALYRVAILQASVSKRQKQAYDSVRSKDLAIEDRYKATPPRNIRGHADDPSEVAEVDQLCAYSNETERPFVDATISQLRTVAGDLKNIKRRLRNDSEAWKRFSVADGTGSRSMSPGVRLIYRDEDFATFIEEAFESTGDRRFQAIPVGSPATVNNRTGNSSYSPSVLPDFDFVIPSAQGAGGVGLGSAWRDRAESAVCWPFSYLLPDTQAFLPPPIPPVVDLDVEGKPMWNYDIPEGRAQHEITKAEEDGMYDALSGHITEAARQLYPEVRQVSQGIWLTFSISKETASAEGDLSGAGPTEQP